MHVIIFHLKDLDGVSLGICTTENACDEVSPLALLDGDGLCPSSDCRPGGTVNLTTYKSGSKPNANPISVSWKLGEGAENSALLETESYYPDWDTCSGCNQPTTSAPLGQSAIFLLGNVLVLLAVKRIARSSSIPA